MDESRLYAAHLQELTRRLEGALAETQHDVLVVDAGRPFTYFADDNHPPHQVTPHFAWWCPVEGPHHLLVLRPGRRPRLIRHAPEDYWYEQAPLGSPFWAAHFDLEEAGDADAVWSRLDGAKRAAYVGDSAERAEAAGLAANPAALVKRLDWERSYKTAYEVERMAEATTRAAPGHRAARGAFLDGASELGIHHAYLAALGACERDLPYPTIVCLDEKSAILHYENKRGVGNGRVLLIDAGARVAGYACDITRTHVSEACEPRFAALLEGMDGLQRRLCDAVKPGQAFTELHLLAHRLIAELLVERGLLRVGADQALAEGLTRPFFPHGLGHHLGIQVHDVAGHQADPAGAPAPPPEAHPFLRNTRTMEPGQVFTIEPGLYFIPMLLRPFRQGPQRDAFDWETIDALTPCGGIRVEDNVLVTEAGHRNLTREQLPS